MWFLVAAVASADSLSLVLHDPEAQSGPRPTCAAPVCASLEALIVSAQHEVLFAFYGFRNQPELLEALRSARARGVVVRGVVDAALDGGNLYASTSEWRRHLPDIVDDQMVDLSKRVSSFRTAPRCPRPPGTRGPVQCAAFDLGDACYLGAYAGRDEMTFDGDIMHDKFVVVDRRWVWTGSTNASDSCAGGYNANVAILVDSPRVASWYAAEFDQMYRGRFHDEKESLGPKQATLADNLSVEVFFSPRDGAIEHGVLPHLQSAQASIDVAMFYLTHKDVTQALIDAKLRGVAVRVLLDASGASNEYSKHDALRAAGVEVRIEDFGGKMHAKAAAIDGRLVIAGSMNWTNAGADDNDENTLVIRSASQARAFAAWFERLWDRVGAEWAASEPDPESRQSGTSCADQVDNDHDGTIDATDPGCRTDAVPARLPPVVVRSPKSNSRCEWPPRLPPDAPVE